MVTERGVSNTGSAATAEKKFPVLPIQVQSLLSSASHHLSVWQGSLKIFINQADLVTVFSDAISVFILKEISNFVLKKKRNSHPCSRNFLQAELAFISSSSL